MSPIQFRTMKRIFGIAACALTCAGAVWATGTPVSLSYRQSYAGPGLSSGVIDQTVDSQGNLYLLADSDILGSHVWTLEKRDALGALLWSKLIVSPAYSQRICVDANQSIYVLGYQFASASSNTQMVTTKFSPSGEFQWSRLYANSGDFQELPLAIHVEANGNVRSATGSTGNGRYLTIVTYDQEGKYLGNYVDHSFSPSQALFTKDGHVVLTGEDEGQQIDYFEILNSSYSTVKLETKAKVGNIGGHFEVGLDPQENVHVALNTYDVSSGFATWNYTLRTLDLSGTQLYSASQYDNSFVNSITAADATTTYVSAFINQGVNQGSYLYKYGPLGLEWAKKGVSQLVSLDGTTGVVAFRGVGSPAVGYLDKYLPDGTTDWTVTAIPATYNYVGFSTIYPPIVANGVIHFATTANLSPSVSNGFAGSVVEGQAVQSVTFPLPKLLGGTVTTGTVNLNVSSPTAFPVGLKCSNPDVLAIPGSSLVPANLSKVGFQCVSSPVDVVTPVTITAKGRVMRFATLTLQPAALTTLVIQSGTVKAGAAMMAAVALEGPTGLYGRTVTLKSSDSTIAKVPASVTIKPGARSATFTIATTAGKTGNVTLSASALGVTKSQPFSVTP